MIKEIKIYLYISVIIIVIGVLILLQQRDRNNPKPINIILIVIDALRADHLGCYGYKRNTSPNIDKLAKEGVMFTQAIAAAGFTVESVPSILAGTYSPTHQVYSFGGLRNPSVKTLAWELAKRGYRCFLWSNHVPVSFLDIKDGFQGIYVCSLNEENYQPVINDHQLTVKVVDWLKAHKDSPFFLYIHYHGSHAPYRPPEPYKSMYLHDKFRDKPEFVPISPFKFDNEAYDGSGVIPYVVAENNITDPNYYISQYNGAISYTDTQIGQLIDGLKELGLEKNTMIILTADHGEMLGEHNVYFNHHGCYEENIRVPLIIRFPKLFLKGKVIFRQVSLIDITPTVLEVIGVDKPTYMQGKNLLRLAKIFCTYHTKYVFSFDRGEYTLRTEKWKLIYSGQSWELYNLEMDPGELRNLVDERPDKFKQLKQELENWKKHITSPIPSEKGPPLIEEDKKALRSLGYVQ